MEEQKPNLDCAYEILESMEGGIKDVRERLAAEQEAKPIDAYERASAYSEAQGWVGEMLRDVIFMEGDCAGRSVELAAKYRLTKDKRLLTVRALLAVLGLRFVESREILERFVADSVNGVEAEV
jgi:hypothetical protein